MVMPNTIFIFIAFQQFYIIIINTKPPVRTTSSESFEKCSLKGPYPILVSTSAWLSGDRKCFDINNVINMAKPCCHCFVTQAGEGHVCWSN